MHFIIVVYWFLYHRYLHKQSVDPYIGWYLNKAQLYYSQGSSSYSSLNCKRCLFVYSVGMIIQQLVFNLKSKVVYCIRVSMVQFLKFQYYSLSDTSFIGRTVSHGCLIQSWVITYRYFLMSQGATRCNIGVDSSFLCEIQVLCGCTNSWVAVV